MRGDLLTLALIVGAFTWAFRYLPTRADLSRIPTEGWLSRFLAATGPAAIATLFVASMLPMLPPQIAGMGPLASGVLVVGLVFALSRSVVGATVAGAAVYGAVFAAMSG